MSSPSCNGDIHCFHPNDRERESRLQPLDILAVRRSSGRNLSGGREFTARATPEKRRLGHLLAGGPERSLPILRQILWLSRSCRTDLGLGRFVLTITPLGPCSRSCPTPPQYEQKKT